LDQGVIKSVKAAHFTGFIFGFTYLTVNLVFGCLFYCAGRFHEVFGDTAEGVLIAIYAIMLGANQAGTAQMFGPDVDKASKVARKIIQEVAKKSRLDPSDKKEEELEI